MTSAEASAAQRVASRSGYPTGHVFDMCAESESCFVVLDGVVGVGEGLLKAGDTFTNSFRFATDATKQTTKTATVEASCILLRVEVSKLTEKVTINSDEDAIAALKTQTEQRARKRHEEQADRVRERDQSELEQLQAEIRVQLAEHQRLGKLLACAEIEERKPLASDAGIFEFRNELMLLRDENSDRARRVEHAEAVLKNFESELTHSLPAAARHAWSLLESLDAGRTAMTSSFMHEIAEVNALFFA